MDGSGMQYFYTNFNVKIGITLEKINFLRKFQKEIFIFKSLHAITQNFKNMKKNNEDFISIPKKSKLSKSF